MINDIATIAELLGFNVKDFSKLVLEANDQRQIKRNQKSQNEYSAYANSENISKCLTEYYRTQGEQEKKEDSSIMQYYVCVDDVFIRTSMFSKKSLLGINRKPLGITIDLGYDLEGMRRSDSMPSVVEKSAAKVINRFKDMGVKIWNAPVYRLKSIDEEMSIEFVMSDFFSHRFTSGLLEDELSQALVDTKGDTNLVIKNKESLLSLREHLLKTTSDLFDFKNRICGGGAGVVFAVARGNPYNDFLILIQSRSHTVSDGRGKYAVIPKGLHQPMGNEAEEVNVHWTIFRELYEEIFGGEDAEKDNYRIKRDWYFDSSEPMKYFRDHIGAYDCQITSLGVNSLAGFYEFAGVIVIRDEWFWRNFGNQMQRMWEVDSLLNVSTRNAKQIRDLIVKGDWAGEGLFHFIEGLIWLKDIDNERVNLPNLSRGLI